MTFKLVGLMSLVLLLCLAAFALMMNSYQAKVMGEVTRTVSEVGRATIQTFERHQFPAVTRDGLSWGPGHEGRKTGYSYDIVADRVEGLENAPPGLKEIPSGHVAIIRLNPHKTAGKEGEAVFAESENKVVMVRIEEVHAEADAAGDTVLRIPTWRMETKALKLEGTDADPLVWFSDGSAEDKALAAQSLAGAEPGTAPGSAEEDAQAARGSADAEPEAATGSAGAKTQAAPGSAASEAFKTTRQEIVLPIPTREFRDLFAGFRKRTLLLFLGIFVFGTLLSAGLAARFTRPVRRLDAGIRRLSEGDLDVRVEAAGRDEVGRLARAFNEMAVHLRAGRERELEMRRREKLSALGRMAAGVAHDVRNPLHSIGLTLQNLQETARPAEPGRSREFDRSVAVIRAEIHRLDRLVENFLHFARSDRATRVPVDLAKLARETAQLVEKEAERRGIRALVVTDGMARVVQGDMESIRSAILNLVLNSFDAMSAGGTLTLTVREAEGEARLEVADTGRGIPEEDQEKVFEFAYTTREHGHGLGLAMVHQVVVEDHGGSVSLKSRLGEGTRVLLAFPLDPAAGTEAAS